MNYKGYEIIGKSTEFFELDENEGQYELGADISEQTIAYIVTDENYRPITGDLGVMGIPWTRRRYVKWGLKFRENM